MLSYYFDDFHYIDDLGDLHMFENTDTLPLLTYGCGIYTLRKIR